MTIIAAGEKKLMTSSRSGISFSLVDNLVRNLDSERPHNGLFIQLSRTRDSPGWESRGWQPSPENSDALAQESQLIN